MERRDFITGLGGAAVASVLWAAWASDQQDQRARRMQTRILRLQVEGAAKDQPFHQGDSISAG